MDFSVSLYVKLWTTACHTWCCQKTHVVKHTTDSAAALAVLPLRLPLVTLCLDVPATSTWRIETGKTQSKNMTIDIIAENRYSSIVFQNHHEVVLILVIHIKILIILILVYDEDKWLIIVLRILNAPVVTGDLLIISIRIWCLQSSVMPLVSLYQTLLFTYYSQLLTTRSCTFWDIILFGEIVQVGTSSLKSKAMKETRK